MAKRSGKSKSSGSTKSRGSSAKSKGKEKDDAVLTVPGEVRGAALGVAGVAAAAHAAGIHDLLQAKQVCSARLLRAGLRGGVVAMRGAPLRLSAAVAAAPRNVHAVGIGYKVVEGKTTNTRCVRIYVVQKLARSVLRDKDVIPPEIEGLPTDVIESQPATISAEDAGVLEVPQTSGGEGRATAAAAPACTTKRRKRQDPKVAGISVAHFNVTAGTIGYFCRSTRAGDNPNDLFVLSNNHVLADTNNGRPGDDVYQPGPADGGTDANHFAELHRQVTIRMGGETPNRVDAAIARLLPGTTLRRSICSIGTVSGTVRATEGMKVRKHGRTTGYTEGEVTDVSYDALVGMDHADPNVVALFEEQIRIEVTPPYPAIGLGGDSGSLVVERPGRRAVGLYFAGPPSGDYGIASHIGDVLRQLEITLL